MPPRLRPPVNRSLQADTPRRPARSTSNKNNSSTNATSANTTTNASGTDGIDENRSANPQRPSRAAKATPKPSASTQIQKTETPTTQRRSKRSASVALVSTAPEQLQPAKRQMQRRNVVKTVESTGTLLATTKKASNAKPRNEQHDEKISPPKINERNRGKVKKNETETDIYRPPAFTDQQIQDFLNDVPKFEVAHCLRMHFRTDANDDTDMTVPDVWACAFAPPLSNDDQSHIVATCGSNSVCFTDCETGRVLMKYSHFAEPNEFFAALDWTIISDDDAFVQILAVGGQAKSIKLINPKQAIFYRYIFGHTAEIYTLKFLQTKTRHLLSSANDHTVRLWDVGPLDINGNATCLAIYKLPFSVVSLAVAPSGDFFLASDSDCAFHVCNIPEKKNMKNDKALALKSARCMDGDNYHTSIVDYLYWLDNDTIVSKGGGDEFRVWSFSKSTSKKQAIETMFMWPWNSEDGTTSYLRGSVIPHKKMPIGLCGTQNGGIMVLDLKHSQSRRKGSKKNNEPYCVLKDSLSCQTIRCVTISHDLKYIVATDENDAVWIWSTVHRDSKFSTPSSLSSK